MPTPKSRQEIYQNKLLQIANAGNSQLGIPDMTYQDIKQRQSEQYATGQQQVPQQAGAIAARRKELLAQGMDMPQALQQMANEGLIDKRIVQRMLTPLNAIPRY